MKRKTVIGDKTTALLQTLADFPAGPSPLVIKASIVPGGTTRFIAAAREIDPWCSIQAHAGNGIVIVRFSEFPEIRQPRVERRGNRRPGKNLTSIFASETQGGGNARKTRVPCPGLM